MNILEAASVLKSGDWMHIALLVAVAIPFLTRGWYALVTSSHRRTHEFLVLWKEPVLRDDALGLEELVRHRYGGAMSADIIRHVLSLSHPSKKLRRLAAISAFFKVDLERRILVWIKPHRAQNRMFVAEVVGCGLGYFFLAFIGGMLLLYGWNKDVWDVVFFSLLGGVSLVFALVLLFHGMALVEARSTLAFVNDRPNSNGVRFT